MNILPSSSWQNDYVIETKNKGADLKSYPKKGSREDRRGCLACSKVNSELQVLVPRQMGSVGVHRLDLGPVGEGRERQLSTKFVTCRAERPCGELLQEIVKYMPNNSNPSLMSSYYVLSAEFYAESNLILITTL